MVRKTFFYLSLPQNCFLGISSIFKTVDNIWYLTGDKTSDFNYYTKRWLLAGIYNSTNLYWLADHSEDFKDTWSFLDRRISDVLKILKEEFED